MDVRFEDRGACEAYLADHLNLSGGDAALEAALLRGFADSCESEEDASSSAPVFDLILGTWVVRDQDLKLFDAAKDATLLLIPVLSLEKDYSVSAAVALLFAAVSLLRNGYVHGANVLPGQLLLLHTLKSAGHPLTPEELLQRLPPTPALTWDVDSVKRELHALSKVATRGGGQDVHRNV